MSRSFDLPHNTHPLLVSGDTHASAGHWVPAIEAWYQAARSDDTLQDAVTRRLDWFLTESGQPARETAGSTLRLVSISFAAALIATVFVLIPDDPGSTASNILASAAWILIVISTVTAIKAARAPTTASLQQLKQRAEVIARTLDITDASEGHETHA